MRATAVVMEASQAESPSGHDVQSARDAGTDAPPERGFLGSLSGLVVLALATAAAAAIGANVTRRPKNQAWYRLLSKPGFTPPDATFSIVWPILYSVAVLSAWRVAKAPAGTGRSVALGLWGTQLAFNAAWSPLFFGQHLPRVALVDLLLTHGSLTAYAVAAHSVDRGAAYLVTPYLGWLTFAGALNGSIVARNRGGFTGLASRVLD